MLNAVSQLGQDAVGNVGRVLGDEIDADPLGPDQPDHLFDLFQQGARGVVEQQVGLVEEEDQARPVRVADLGKLLEQFRQQPQQEGRIQARTVHQPRRIQHIDLAPAVQPDADHVLQLQRRLAEEGVAALLLDLQQRALDGGDGGGGDIADLAPDPLGVLAHIDQQAAQIVQVQQQQALLVRDMEDDGQHALLHLVQVQHPRHQHRADLGDGGADRMTLLAIQVPEDHRRGARRQGQAHLGRARDQLVAGRADLRNARQVALHVGAKDRHACVGKALGHDLQRHRLAGAGGPGDHAVSVGAVEQQVFRLGCVGLAEEQAGQGVGHWGLRWRLGQRSSAFQTPPEQRLTPPPHGSTRLG